MTRALLAALALLALPARAGRPVSPYITEEMDRLLIEGIDDIYRMRFAEAEEAARRVVAMNPEHPHGYLGLAGVSWTRFVYGSDQSDPALLKPYEDRTREAIRVAEAWVKKHPDDPQGLMVLGAAHGLYSRLLVIQKEWIKGYLHGRRAVAITREAVKADPSFVDAYLGLGMYDYYTDVLPRFIGVLAKIVFRGNRLRGIEYLKKVAAEGHYAKSNAMILLVEIYTEDRFGSRDPKRAVEIMAELRRLYPDSAMMHSAQLVALYTAERHEDVIAGAREYIELARKGAYSALEEAKGQVILGCGLWAAGRLDEALAAFRAGNGIPVAGRLSRWSVWAHVRAGNLLDALGRREEAVADYRVAATEPDSWGFRKLAKVGLSRPYAEKRPGPIPPPY